MNEIAEWNKLIAEFEGAKVLDWTDNTHVEFPQGIHSRERYALGALHYHTSWDWLMPVVEKIEGLGFKFQICRKRVTMIHDNRPNEEFGTIKMNSKIDSVWYAATQFITWYNQNKTS